MTLHIDKFKTEDGGYEDETGCYYEDSKEFIQTSIFDFCGCIGDSAMYLILETMVHFDTWTEKGIYWDDLVRESFNGNEAAAYITATMLDEKGLIEHGTAIRGSWLTQKGKEVLSDLKQLYKSDPEIITPEKI